MNDDSDEPPAEPETRGASSRQDEDGREKAAGAGPTLWAVLATFLASVVGVAATFYTQMLVGRSAHAEEFSKAFADNRQSITGFMSSFRRSDEQAADMSLTALYDFAQTYEDRIAMLTIAARMLNANDCPSSGEATARFLTIIVHRIEHDAALDARNPFGPRENARLLDFVRSQPFLVLASDDVPLTYFNDDASGPIVCGSTVAAALRAQPSATPLPPLYTPSAADPRNHATFWGERAPWNDSKNGLFRELRRPDYSGWIHVATWETADACVDESGRRRRFLRHSKMVLPACTPIRVHYTSRPFAFRIATAAASDAGAPFWLGRARFLRDAPPRVYAHYDDANMMYRAVLGHVIGVVDYGECVAPLTPPRYYWVSTANGRRHFVHVWIQVRAADSKACWPQD